MGTEVAVANGETIAPEFQSNLPLTETLSPRAQKAYLFEDIKNGSLISLGKLCDDDCIVIFPNMKLTSLKRTPS